MTWRRWDERDAREVVVVNEGETGPLRVCGHCAAWRGSMVRLSYSHIYHVVDPTRPRVTRCGRYFHVGLPD